MKVLILNQYYYPDIAATAQLCADLAEDLVALGHQVTAVAGTASYRTPHEGDRALPPGPLPLKEEHRGVRILRVPVLSLPPSLSGALSGERREMISRSLGYASFLAGALARLLTQERPDVVLALSTPPLVAALALLPQALRGARFVYWVQDVYPDLAIELGVMRAGGPAARAFSALSHVLYQRADALVVLDDAMAARLREAGAPADRIHVIDNWCDSNEVTPQPASQSRLRQALGLGDAFTVGYAGNMGRGHDAATLIEAMPLLRDDPITWLFVGAGPGYDAVARAASAERLPRVHFLPPQARAMLRDTLTAADVGLVTADAALSGLLAPSKLYGLLAAGRPILWVGPDEGRVAELIREEGVGVAVRNGDIRGLCAAVRRLAADPEGCRRMGARARQVLEARYTRALATARHEAVLRQVVLRGAAGGRP